MPSAARKIENRDPVKRNAWRRDYQKKAEVKVKRNIYLRKYRAVPENAAKHIKSSIAWHNLNPTKTLEARRRYVATHKDSVNAASYAWRAANPAKAKAFKDSWYARNGKKYKLTKLETRAGRPKPASCEVCGRSGKICFDHDHRHVDGLFRGWLCNRCNLALGAVDDSPIILRKLAKYLLAYTKRIERAKVTKRKKVK